MGLSLVDFGGFRDAEFRKYFIEANYHAELSFAYLKDKEISDKDLLQFYLEYSKLCDKYPQLNTDLIRTLFNYKLGRVSEERLIQFKKIVKSKTGLWIGNYYHFKYYSLMDTIGNESIFKELVDIFLDEV